MIQGPDWVVTHLRQPRGQGNTIEGRAWTLRVREKHPQVVFFCDACVHQESVDVATQLERFRHLMKQALRHEVRFGEHRCQTCMRGVAVVTRNLTTSDPTWLSQRAPTPSWQSQATPQELASWIKNSRVTRLATTASKTPEERRRGVQKQWQSLTPEAREARAAKIGAWSKKHWAEMTPEARADRVRKMVKGLPRSIVSDQFRAALQQAGLYAGFQSEVTVSGFVVDECDPDRKLILEFHGDYYHCNPRKFTDPDWVNPTLRMTCAQKWKYDRRRLACFLNQGFRVLVIWEDEWVVRPADVLERVRVFLGAQLSPPERSKDRRTP